MFVLYIYNNLLYIDRRGHDDGNLRYPTSTVVTPEHTVLISDLSNDNNLLYIDRLGHDDGYLGLPTSTVVTPEHTVLIADYRNNRISEFSLDEGRFIRQVLTSKDGIYSPRCISLQGELLWLSYRVTGSFISDMNIQCYKLYTD